MRAITNPFSDIVEDSNAALVAGSYNATADLASGAWVMQMVAFSTTPVTYVNTPAVSSIAPVSGPNLGGTMVTITGTDFQPGAVAFLGTAPGGISLLNCTESGGTTITCVTPSDTAGAKDVTVVNVDGKLGSAAAAYTYIDVKPTISAINPPSGPTNGSAITITGANFEAGATVTIGGLPVGNVVVQDSATITGDTPGLSVELPMSKSRTRTMAPSPAQAASPTAWARGRSTTFSTAAQCRVIRRRLFGINACSASRRQFERCHHRLGGQHSYGHFGH